MILRGQDSAYGPTRDQAAAAKADGVDWWGCYIGGPGAFHVWTDAEIAVLRDEEILPLPIWVPTASLSESPTAAAEVALSRCAALDLFGPVVLDTEAGMDASGRLDSFVQGFCARIGADRRPAVVYAGAGYVPPGVFAWRVDWGSTLEPSAGEAVQYGPTTRWGMSVDDDLAGAGFPLGSWSPPPPPLPEADVDNLIIIHDTASLGWRLWNTVTNTFANFTGNQPEMATLVNAGIKVLAWPGADSFQL